MDTLIDVKTFPARTGLNKSTLRRMWIAGTGPVRVEIDRRVLIAERDAAAWLDAFRRVRGAPDESHRLSGVLP
jgi:hypothetical protein